MVSTDGNIIEKRVQIYGRKIPLLEIRERLMKQHQRYMRLTTDEDLEALTRPDLILMATNCHLHLPPDVSDVQLRDQLALAQRTRTLALWHDHSTILQTGYILFAVWVVYDRAVFLTPEEYLQKRGKQVRNLQEIIEDPLVYMIAPSTSSPSDQLALIGDRLECVAELSQKIASSNGIAFQDELRFFCGDKPAQQFERGTQIGGTYKCGSCGCKDTMMQDLAHSLNCKWRSLTDLQQLVVAGTYGKNPGRLKPLDGLRIQELRKELQSRGYQTDEQLKPQLQAELTALLSGAQRVPTLLILNPTQPLASLNLPRYEVLDCEPLHDIKGHLHNLLPEIPHLLSPDLKEQCQRLLDTTIPKQKVSGAMLRTASIKLFLKLLQHEATNPLVVQLVRTAVKISELFYHCDSKRTPKSVLQLYNVTWLHHELCAHLIHSPKEQFRSHLFGIYLHDIAVHAAPQYEIVCLRSTNAESQERLFTQIKQTSLRATNRKVENVVPTVLLSLQAKQKVAVGIAMNGQDSIVSAVAKNLPIYPGTSIDKHFVHSRLHSWQAHLQRISRYLIHGEGIWWSQDTQVYRFHDSDLDQDNHHEGPTLKHFRHTSLPDVHRHNSEVWQEILKSSINLPATNVRIYNEDGTYIGERCYPLSDPTSGSSDSLCTPLTDPPTDSSDSLCTPLTDPPTDSSDSLCAPLPTTPSDSSDSLCTPLTDPPTGSSIAWCSAMSASTTTANIATSNGHPNPISSAASTPISSHHAQKPTRLFTSPPIGEQNLHTTAPSQESPATETEKDIALLWDITHLQQDETEDTELHIHVDVAPTCTQEYKTKAAMLISKVVNKQNPTLKKFDNLRSILKAKKEKKQTPTLSEKELYQKLMAQLHTAITSSKDALKSDLRTFEKEYYKSHGVFPQQQVQYIQLRKLMNLAKQLLTTWHSFDIHV